MTESCKHHHCTPSCLYGGRNQLVTSLLGKKAQASRWYRGFLCCKCHKVMVVLQEDAAPVAFTKECQGRWEEYDRLVRAHIDIFGPLGG